MHPHSMLQLFEAVTNRRPSHNDTVPARTKAEVRSAGVLPMAYNQVAFRIDRNPQLPEPPRLSHSKCRLRSVIGTMDVCQCLEICVASTERGFLSFQLS